VHHLRDTLADLRDREAVIRAPLHQWVQAPECSPNTAALIELVSAIYGASVKILQFLEGGRVHRLGDWFPDGESARNTWKFVSTLLEASHRMPSLEHLNQDRQLAFGNQAAPIIQGRDGAHYALGARALVEASALACQLTHEQHGEADAVELVEHLSTMLNTFEYVVAQKLLEDMVGDQLGPSEA
jgi:hypothetical protein